MNLGLRTILLLVAMVLFVLGVFSDTNCPDVRRPRARGARRRLPHGSAGLGRPHVRHTGLRRQRDANGPVDRMTLSA